MKQTRKALAILLAFIFVVSVVPAAVFASVEQTSTKAASKFKMKYSSVTLQVKKQFAIDGEFTLPYLPENLKLSSSNPAVASVDPNTGVVTGKKAGSAVISMKLNYGNGQKETVTCQVKVQNAAVAVASVKASPVSLAVGTKKSVKADVEPITANQKKTYKSANPKIAKVSTAGVVTGVSAGKTKITVTAGKKSATISVNVVSAPKSGAPVYRALLINNADYSYWRQMGSDTTDLPSQNDVTLMKELLGSTLNGSNRNIPMQIRTKADLEGSSQILSAIQSAFAGAKENDVSYLFFSGHGAADNGVSYLCGVGGSSTPTLMDALLNVDQLEAALSEIPGKVVVILSACFSGGFINRSADNGSFNDGVIKAFSSNAKQRAYLSDDKTEKYYVLTICSKTQEGMSLSVPFGANFMVTTLTNSLYFSAYDYLPQNHRSLFANFPNKTLKADADKNKVVTLQEAYSYSVKLHKNLNTLIPQFELMTHGPTQVYPQNSDFPLFSFR